MHDNDINIYSRFAYSEKLRIDNWHAPFAQSPILNSIEQEQLSMLFTKFPRLSKYYPNRQISELQIFDVVDDFSSEPYITVFLFKEHCQMFRHNKTEIFGYIGDSTNGFALTWNFTGSTPAENLLRRYISHINLKEALNLFWLKNKKTLARYVYIDLFVIEMFRSHLRAGTLAESKFDPTYTPIYNEAYEWIELKVLNIITYVQQQNCTILPLDHYCLESLPEAICDCKHLDSIDLSGNQLTSLPDNFQRLTNLRHIDLSDNSFPEFPIQLRDMPVLETINLRGNYIEILPSYIAAMKHLRKLDIGRNSIKNIPEKLMEGPDSTSKVIKYLSTL